MKRQTRLAQERTKMPSVEQSEKEWLELVVQLFDLGKTNPEVSEECDDYIALIHHELIPESVPLTEARRFYMENLANEQLFTSRGTSDRAAYHW